MELWIRSQDKHSLIKVYDLQIDSITFENRVFIINCRTNRDCAYLGEYKSVERALEVLDEIQNCITGYTTTDTITWGDDAFPYEVPPTNFYQMPKE